MDQVIESGWLSAFNVMKANYARHLAPSDPTLRRAAGHRRPGASTPSLDC